MHGSGSTKDSNRNRYLSDFLNKNGYSTFLFNLLTEKEIESDIKTEELIVESKISGLTLNKFNIKLLTNRIIDATQFRIQNYASMSIENFGYFAISTGSAAALRVIKTNPELFESSSIGIKTIVSRGGRPDLIEPKEMEDIQNKIKQLMTPLLFIVGEKDKTILDSTKANVMGFRKSNSDTMYLQIVKGVSHLFEEQGAIEKVAQLAKDWFDVHL